MAIERIEITHHQLALDPPLPAAWDPRPRRLFPATIVRVHDDSGQVGIGSGDDMAGFEAHAPLFLGQDPLDLERHASVLANLDFLGARPWPFDVALWDLAGKLRGEALWKMLGGRCDRVRPYASSAVLRGAAETAQLAERVRAAGFGALKLRFGRPDRRDDFAALEAARSAVGSDLELMVDCNQGWRMPWDTRPPWTVEEALDVAAELARHGVHWMEEPLHRGDYEGMARLAAESGVTLAGGELTREGYEFRELLDRGCLAVLQPDVVCTLGVAGLRDLALEIRARGAVFTPHTWGNGIGLLANLHVTAATGGAEWIEYPWDPPEWSPERRDFMLASPVLPDAEGELALTEQPGLGLVLDEDRLRATRSHHATYG